MKRKHFAIFVCATGLSLAGTAWGAGGGAAEDPMIHGPQPVPPAAPHASPDTQSATDAGSEASSTYTYTVKKGETLETIARRQLGRSEAWREIASLNRLTGPADVEVGQEIRIPHRANPPVGAAPPAMDAPAAGSSERFSAADEAKPADPSSARASAAEYVVKKGDTLAEIAREQLGKTERWTDIAQLNGIRDPNALEVGQKLKLPAQAEIKKRGPAGAERTLREDR